MKQRDGWLPSPGEELKLKKARARGLVLLNGSGGGIVLTATWIFRGRRPNFPLRISFRRYQRFVEAIPSSFSSELHRLQRETRLKLRGHSKLQHSTILNRETLVTVPGFGNREDSESEWVGRTARPCSRLQFRLL